MPWRRLGGADVVEVTIGLTPECVYSVILQIRAGDNEHGIMMTS